MTDVAPEIECDGCAACRAIERERERWGGPVCSMCNGTGQHYAAAGTPIDGTPFTDGARTIPTGLRCPACNGHGREAT